MSIRNKRRTAQRELHTHKMIEARLLSVDVSGFMEKTKINIHYLNGLIKKARTNS